jgi:hypothetical protein
MKKENSGGEVDEEQEEEENVMHGEELVDGLVRTGMEMWGEDEWGVPVVLGGLWARVSMLRKSTSAVRTQWWRGSRTPDTERTEFHESWKSAGPAPDAGWRECGGGRGRGDAMGK